ncbi:DNA polymerase epsilon subunit 2 [Prorops nasuta]|uniref:DNA polymerase epsilon subunit 2 n=1 Tax=Prorops nasuta TaxID=863751 RepID=UPI0034CEC87E
MAHVELIKTVQSTFSLFGLVLNRNLAASLVKQLVNIAENERDDWITQIAERILEQNLPDPHVEIKHIKLALEECVKPDSLKDTETVLNAVNAFDIPKIKYDISKNKFVMSKVQTDLYSDAINKTHVFRDRLDLLWYRTKRHEFFAAPKFGETKDNKFDLVPIEYLLSEAQTEDVCIMGIVAQFTDNQYYLEDSGGNVKLDLKKANFQNGLVMEGSIVIANGFYEDKIFKVQDVFFPPAEKSENSRVDFGNLNTFGGPSPVLLKTSEKLDAYEKSSQDMIVFISELWLDNATVLSKFKTMLDGYSDFPPVAFVICGNFLSFPLSVTSVSKAKEGFKKLADIIMQYTNIYSSSKFIFVPGPYDLGSPKILPRAPLPKFITEDFSSSIPGSIFASNPCRIQYCTKEIVVLREDMLTKMCRNTINFPDEGLICDHFARSIISQSHLTPLSLPVIPIYWKHDHALQIYPTPDLIVVADQFEAYTTKYTGCYVINPGMFPKNNFAFKAYVPSSETIEDCEIPAEIT